MGKREENLLRQIRLAVVFRACLFWRVVSLVKAIICYSISINVHIWRESVS